MTSQWKSSPSFEDQTLSNVQYIMELCLLLLMANPWSRELNFVGVGIGRRAFFPVGTVHRTSILKMTCQYDGLNHSSDTVVSKVCLVSLWEVALNNYLGRMRLIIRSHIGVGRAGDTNIYFDTGRSTLKNFQEPLI